MNFDITHLLESWDYQPGQVMVRRFKNKDGVEKIQLRVDLGILQMNAQGRPDGKRPNGHGSLFEYFQAQLKKHLEASPGDAEGFSLNGEDCGRLQLEALQYHHRYICLLQLDDYQSVLRDTERNLELFDFVQEHAAEEDLAWSLQQFRPQLLMMRTRAQAAIALDEGNYAGAIELVEEGIRHIRRFFADYDRPELEEQCGELISLEDWLEDIRADRPLTKREKLEQALEEAVRNENYEKAAQVRDALRKLEAADS